MAEASLTKDKEQHEPASPDQSQQRPRRWRLRFSLATVLVVVTLFGAWLGFLVNRAHRQRIAVAEIERAGGGVFYDYQFDGAGYLDLKGDKSRSHWLGRCIGRDYVQRVESVQMKNANNEALFHLESLPDVDRVFLSKNPDVTDEGLVHLRYCKRLSYLDLNDTGVRGPGLAHLSQLPRLQFVLLSSTPLDDDGLKHVAGLSTLTCLQLMDTRVTDVGVSHLKTLRHLEDLSLSYTSISDRGLNHLQHLTHLRDLSLKSTKTTPEAVNRLQFHLPSCKIDR